MIKVYSVALGVGLALLVAHILADSLASNLGRSGAGRWWSPGARGKMALGCVLGFGMGGMAAEFSPLGLGWQVSLLIAALAAVASVAWVRFSTKTPTG